MMGTYNNMDESQIYLWRVEELFHSKVHTMKFHLYNIFNGEKKKIKKVVSSRDLEGGWQALLGKVMRELSEITVT